MTSERPRPQRPRPERPLNNRRTTAASTTAASTIVGLNDRGAERPARIVGPGAAQAAGVDQPGAMSSFWRMPARQLIAGEKSVLQIDSMQQRSLPSASGVAGLSGTLRLS